MTKYLRDLSLHRLSPVILLLGIYGFAISLAFQLGGYRSFLHASLLPFAWMLFQGRGTLPWSEPLWWLLGLGGVFLLQGLAMATGPIEGGHHEVLGWSLFAAILITLLPARAGPRGDHRSLLAVITVVFVLAQVGAWFWRPQPYMDGRLLGVFSNPHYLALYTLLALGLLIYLIDFYRGWRGWLLGVVLVLDVLLLILSRSLPAWLGLVAGTLVLLPYAPRWRAVMTLALFLLLLAGVHLSGWFDLSVGIKTALIYLASDERWVLWREFWILQQESIGWQWLLGHGFGQFLNDYMPVSSFHAQRVEPYFDFASPHNYFLELLYSHGFIGVLLLCLAYGLWLGGLVRGINTSGTVDQRRQGMLLLSLVTAQCVLGFFTMPFFARHNLFPVSVLLGISLRYLAAREKHD
jgi:O-antigen ligase